MVILIPKYVDVSKANADPLVFRVHPERLRTWNSVETTLRGLRVWKTRMQVLL